VSRVLAARRRSGLDRVVVPQRRKQGIQAGVENRGRATVGGFLATDDRGDQALRVVDDRAAAFENQRRALFTLLDSVGSACQESAADRFGVFIELAGVACSGGR
jgi:hypothetical protein